MRSPESWKAVIGYEGLYEVSSFGRVRSLPRTVTRHDGYTQSYHGRVLRQRPDLVGYPVVSLSRGGQRKGLHVHVLAMRAFVGDPPDGMECCHWDGDKANNRIENLRYGTRSDNMRDRKRHGTDNAGSRHGCSKLTEERVVAIRSEYAAGGKTYKQLGKKYGVGGHAIGLIIRRQRWRHV